MTKVILLLVLAVPSIFGQQAANSKQKLVAEEFLRGLYGCNPEVVDKLAADNIAVSYPIFQKIFNKPAIRGKTDVRDFARHFCSVWKNGELTIDDAIEEGNQVVFVWSFKAESTGAAPGAPEKGTVDSWGGISLFRFNDEGKITVEVGEESDPGPMARLRSK